MLKFWAPMLILYASVTMHCVMNYNKILEFNYCLGYLGFVVQTITSCKYITI